MARNTTTRALTAAVALLAASVSSLVSPSPAVAAGSDRGRTDIVANPFYNVNRGATAISDDGRFVLSHGDHFVMRDMIRGTSTVLYDDVTDGFSESTMSADGRFVTFVSRATKIDPRATGGWENVFLRDMQAGTTRMVSRIAGTQTGGADQSSRPLISRNGRYVVFESYAAGLVDGATRGRRIYRYDRQTDKVELVSANTSGGPAGIADVGQAAISDDGEVVAFVTSVPADQLVPGASDHRDWATSDVFVRDMVEGTTTVVSHAVGSQAAVWGDKPQVSGNGQTVVFEGVDTVRLTGQPENSPGSDVFAFDRASGNVELISVSALRPGTADKLSSDPAVSADGRTVAFLSQGTDLVEGWTDVNNPPPGMVPALDSSYAEVFVRHRDSATTDLATRSATARTTASQGAWRPVISADGRLVVFESEALDLVDGLNGRTPGDGGPCCKRDIYSFDTSSSEVRAVSIDDSKSSATLPGWSAGEKVTPDGRFVAFSWNEGSRFNGLVPMRRAMEPPLPPVPPPGTSWGAPTILRPVEGETQVDTTVPFRWSAVPGAGYYLVTVGGQKGGYDMVLSGALPASQTSYDVPCLPDRWDPVVWLRIYSFFEGSWNHYTDVSFRPASCRASIDYPMFSANNVDTSQPIRWSPVTSVGYYMVTVGRNVAGYELLYSGLIPADQTSYSMAGLPPNVLLWARVYSYVGGSWNNFSDVQFTAGMPGAPTFLNPTLMSLSNPSQTYQWTSVPGARYYLLTLGRQRGGYEVLFSGALGPNQTAYFAGAVSNQPLWARVYSYVDGSWNHYTDLPFIGLS